MSTRVTILSVFAEDGRISMELYAAYLRDLLNSNENYEVDLFEPVISPLVQKLPLNTLNKMRIARYYDYPRQVKKLDSNRRDLFHIADHGYAHLIGTLPKEKTLITVHDLIPIAAYNGAIPGMEYQRKPSLAFASAKKLKDFRQIITISESSKADIIQYCDVDPNRITVIHYGLDPSFTTENKGDEQLLANYNLSDKPIILSSGSSIYKNTKTVLDAFKLIRHKYDIQLCHIGPDYDDLAHYAASIGISENVHFLGRTSPTNIKALYRKANHLIFPSLYEGFGLPPLEAMACGCPAIVSNRASLPEVVGEAGLICDAFDVEAIAHFSEKLLTNASFHREVRQQSIERSQQFTWNKYAKELLALYENFLN